MKGSILAGPGCHGEERRVRLLNEGLLRLCTAGAQSGATGRVSGEAEAVSVERRSLMTCL